MIANPSHLKRPNVTKLIGKRRTFTIGLIIIVVSVNTNPVKSRVDMPFSKYIPDIATEVP